METREKPRLFGDFCDMYRTDVPPLICMFFAEFHQHIGRQITIQVPEEVITRDFFETFSSFVLPKQEVMDNLIKLNLPKFKVMGFPIGLSHSKYPRNEYLFNLCFVVENISDVDCLYEPLVQKLAYYLKTLEKETEFLHNPETRKRLEGIMTTLFEDLNKEGQSSIKINDRTTICLKLNSHSQNPPEQIPSYMAPVFVRDPPEQSQLAKLDVLSQKIVPFIDGCRSIAEIASEESVQIDQDLVSRCVKNLHFHGFLAMIPLFEYRSTYVATGRVEKLINESKFQEKCIEFVALKRSGKNNFSGSPKIGDILRLYCSLQPGVTLKDWCLRKHPRELYVDEKKLIQFGITHGLVRKLIGYPVFGGKNYHSRNELEMDCNGQRNLADLAIKHSFLPWDLEKMFNDGDRIVIVWK